MYSHLSWIFLSLDEWRATIVVDGTGLWLEVLLSPLALAKFLIGDKISLPIYHHHTDLGDTLFGFQTNEEKAIFRKLLKVNGVGGKTALNILGLWVESIIKAIELQDDALLSSVPGIGKKTAQKIIVDLKGSIDFASLAAGKNTLSPKYVSTDMHLISSLVQMGYDKIHVEQIISEIASNLSIEIKTIEAIKKLSKK